MDNTPILTPTGPRFAPPRMHLRNPSQSPTRKRFADDLLSDLSPATTLEAFTNPSGKLKASVEAATPSERAFGIRATIASKNIQEWLDELSNWPWPSEGGSVGFEMPATKRRKLSDPFVDHNTPQSYEKSGMTNNDEPQYIGSLLADEVDQYEDRIDEIQADMEELNVEDIKRQVLDTHFSPRSRPSSSASNAAPMPQFLSSYTKMDDFTAVVTSTVLQSLPNLSRLMRLMDVWTIRLSVLRKVPPLLLALEDAEIALKSGWNAIQNPAESDALSRETFDVMQNVLRNKVTKLGRDLDFLLDTLEGRPDTLPDSWLDRMEVIENDYGSWDVAGDRKVREGEWAKLAKKRKEEEDARKLREAEEAEIARRKVEQEEKEEAERLARRRAEDDAKRKADREAREAQDAESARLRAIQEAEEAAKLEAQMEAEALETARLKSEREAARIEAARVQAEQEAEVAAQRQAEQEAQDLARHKAQEEADLKAEHEAACLKALKEAEDAAIRQAQIEAEMAEKAKLKAEQEARDLAQREAEEEAARKHAQREAEHSEAARLKGLKDAEDEAVRQTKLEAEIADTARVKAEQEATDIAKREAEEAAAQKAHQDAEELERARLETEKEVQEAAIRQARLHAEAAETTKLQVERESEEQAGLHAEKEALEAKLAEQHVAEARATEVRLQAAKDALKRKADEEVEGVERARLESQRETEEALSAEASKQQVPEDAGMETMTMQMETEAEPAQLDKESQVLKSGTGDGDDHSSKQSPGCPTRAEIQDSDGSPSPRDGSRATMRSSTSRPSSSKSPVDVLKSSLLGYASYDGIDDCSSSVLSSSDETHLGQDPDLKRSVLDSPIHFDNRNTESPATASPVRSTAVGSEEPKTPQSQKLPRFGNVFANALRRTSTSPPSSTLERPRSSSSPQADNHQEPESPKTPIVRPRTPANLLFLKDRAEDILRPNSSTSMKSNEDGWVVISSSDEEDAQASEPDMSKTDSSQGSPTKPRDSASSVILGYSITDPTPEIQEAEPAEYFEPVLSPIKNARSPIANSAPATPSKSLVVAPELAFPEVLPNLDGPTSPRSPFLSRPGLQALRAKSAFPSLLERGGDECESCDSLAVEPEIARPSSVPVLADKESISRINTAIRRISISRRGSTSSEASTVINARAGESPSLPMASLITSSPHKSFEQADASPSAGRIGHRIKKSYDFSPPDSPQHGSRLSPQRSLQILKSPNLSPPSPNTSSTPIEAPSFDNLDVTTTSIVPSPKKATTDEQIQQQISSLLETIPARIRLTSEPTSSPFTSQTLRPKKARRSITPNARPSSTMSNYSTSTTYSRAATPGPQFTLAPAFGKSSQRTRTHNGNPEIKLYHLSRSTGEAPIKLFVRLVGEHGERVMVRVGGGWADLGEYLKEYASHHGRRSAADAGDKVEIQDLPPRIVSNSSTTSTIRGSGRDTPVSRPFSVLERERPSSSLNVRKTRKSIGDNDPSSQLRPRLNDTRSPSTPLPLATRRVYETPPSVAASAASSTSSNGRSSRMSWTEEDSSLGLAGPKSKKVVISEKDQEWVESMKEKVRLASAEKEKREKERDRKASFGEMDKVGGTKRLFRKG